jgi:RNA polymerase sigma-70 factor (ECF subfamily)
MGKRELQGTSPGPSPTVDAAFSAFYRQFVPTLVGFLMWQGARLTDAADIVQDTMSEVYRYWSTIHEPEAWGECARRNLLKDGFVGSSA